MPFWYVVRTKPKHEHIAAANLERHMRVQVFLPRLKLEKLTRRGLVRVTEPLFPCYLFVYCVIDEHLANLQHVGGISKVVRFGDKIPHVSEGTVKELQWHFRSDDTLVVENPLMPGDEVVVTEGAFAGLDAMVLKHLPARRRVQVLLEMLGRPTPVEVSRETLMAKRNTLAELAPALAAPGCRERTELGV